MEESPSHDPWKALNWTKVLSRMKIGLIEVLLEPPWSAMVAVAEPLLLVASAKTSKNWRQIKENWDMMVETGTGSYETLMLKTKDALT